MKIELAFPFDFAQVHLALEAPEVICCILIPDPVNIFRLQPGSALIKALLGGLWGVAGIAQGLGLKLMLNNVLNETWEWGLSWAGRV